MLFVLPQTRLPLVTLPSRLLLEHLFLASRSSCVMLLLTRDIPASPLLGLSAPSSPLGLSSPELPLPHHLLLLYFLHSIFQQSVVFMHIGLFLIQCLSILSMQGSPHCLLVYLLLFLNPGHMVKAQYFLLFLIFLLY